MKIPDKRAHSRCNNYVCVKEHKICSALPSQERYEITEMPDTTFLLGNLLEASISENGIGFISETEYAVGDLVEVSIQFHDKQTGFAAVICGEVKWVRLVADGVHETGVQFINIPEALRKRISQFIRAES